MRVFVEMNKAQVDNQETQDIAQGKAAGIAHKQLMAFLGIAEYIVTPERNQDSQGSQCQKGVNILSYIDMHVGEHGKRDAAQTGSQSVDAVYQVDGVGDINDKENGKWNAQPCRKVVNTEQSTQRTDPVAARNEQQGCQYLYQELPAVTYTNQVILHTRQIQQHGTDNVKQEFIQGTRQRKVFDRYTMENTKSHYQRKSDDNGR